MSGILLPRACFFPCTSGPRDSPANFRKTIPRKDKIQTIPAGGQGNWLGGGICETRIWSEDS